MPSYNRALDKGLNNSGKNHSSSCLLRIRRPFFHRYAVRNSCWKIFPLPLLCSPSKLTFDNFVTHPTQICFPVVQYLQKYHAQSQDNENDIQNILAAQLHGKEMYRQAEYGSHNRQYIGNFQCCHSKSVKRTAARRRKPAVPARVLSMTAIPKGGKLREGA